MIKVVLLLLIAANDTPKPYSVVLLAATTGVDRVSVEERINAMRGQATGEDAKRLERAAALTAQIAPDAAWVHEAASLIADVERDDTSFATQTAVVSAYNQLTAIAAAEKMPVEAYRAAAKKRADGLVKKFPKSEGAYLARIQTATVGSTVGFPVDDTEYLKDLAACVRQSGSSTCRRYYDEAIRAFSEPRCPGAKLKKDLVFRAAHRAERGTAGAVSIKNAEFALDTPLLAAADIASVSLRSSQSVAWLQLDVKPKAQKVFAERLKQAQGANDVVIVLVGTEAVDALPIEALDQLDMLAEGPNVEALLANMCSAVEQRPLPAAMKL